DLLKQLDREDLNQLWDLVKEYLSIRPATSEKEMELWVELKRLYEPDPEDQLWTLTQNFMHAPVEWKLYDLSGVHHLTAKDKEIFMLVEKDYPLRKGLVLVMISYKLQGRIVRNKMHKAFPLLVRKFSLPEGTSHCLKMNATVRRIEMPLPEVCTTIEEKKKKLPNDQNDVESDDERVALANLIANLKLDVDENKKIQKQSKKANTTLAHELKECKTILAETSKTLGESNSVWDSCLVALQKKQTEFEKYKAFNDRTVDYNKLECKLNETLGKLAQKDIEIKEGLKLKAYEISVVKDKHDELIKHSLLTKSHYEGLVKQKAKVITNLKLKEEHDINKMLSLEK
nr:hypothetical protein [Tanacetum cinerariifolium]